MGEMAMRHACLAITVAAVVGAGAGLTMGEEIVFEGPVVPVTGGVEVVDAAVIQGDVIPADPSQEGGVMPACCEQCGSHECGSHCQTATRCGACRRAACPHCGRHRRVAAAANFNCCCQGSYKFPVPRQYTYHWPGMYSQQQMTAYSSPYRFPPLELPPGYAAPQPRGRHLASDSPIRQISTVTPSAQAPRAGAPRPGHEWTSEKPKRMYGLK